MKFKILALSCLILSACSELQHETNSSNTEPNAVFKGPEAMQQAQLAQAHITSVNETVIKAGNVVVDSKANTLYLPVKPGTNLKNLDPKFQTIEPYSIEPNGEQNFTDGPVTYTLYKNQQKVQTLSVSANVDVNPVLEGFYADPEIIYSEREQKYYLYPTSDGHMSWSGTYFKTFSSPDLIHWKNEGTILDLKQDVAWANRNAWAPAAAERLVNVQYRYFYYFTAAQKIGVASAKNPTGPFVDSGRPLVDFKPEGVSNGQEIDPDVFLDPESGQSYLYWGNGYLAMAELNEDMVSIKRDTLKVLTPDDTFREGVEVFYRQGIYYFLWSENDTRSPDYRVRYATATSPTGPLHIPENNLILAKEPAKGIYGTGHNSVINVPDTDCWYIVYHRFNRPHGIHMGRPAGFHREVAIDPLQFDKAGAIKPVKPSLQGLAFTQTDACENTINQ